MVEVLLVFISIMLLICLAVFAADFVPVFMTWLKRIHIGRYTDKKQWYEKAGKIAMKQIEKLPPIPVTDKTSYTLLPKLKGEYYNLNFSSWQIAALLKVTSGNKNARAAAYRFFDKENWFGRDYNAGAGMLFYEMLCNGFENDENFRAAADDFMKKISAAAGDTTLPYSANYKERYVDTLGLVCPFLIKYYQTYGCQEALEIVKRQFDEYYTYGINDKTGLPVHCFNPETELPLGLYGWGRGCGWLALALTECIQLLDGKDEYAEVLRKRAHNLAESLIPYQNKNGSFNCIIGVPFSREDSSATAMIGGLLALLGYKSEAEKCLSFIMSVTRRNGEVDFAQGDTMGIGNYSRRFEPMPAAQAFSICLAEKIFENS